MSQIEKAIERVVADMTDYKRWPWTYMLSQRDAAHRALSTLAREGLIEHAEHPLGGAIWRVNGKLYGRTDGITQAKFKALEARESDGAKASGVGSHRASRSGVSSSVC